MSAVSDRTWEEVGPDETEFQYQTALRATKVIAQFAIGQAAQLGYGFPVAAPVAIVADQVHGTSRFVNFRFGCSRVRCEDRWTPPAFEARLLHGSDAFCALQHKSF
jgi:hypothetical protein